MRKTYQGSVTILFNIELSEEDIRDINGLEEYEEIIEDDIENALCKTFREQIDSFDINDFEYEEI